MGHRTRRAQDACRDVAGSRNRDGYLFLRPAQGDEPRRNETKERHHYAPLALVLSGLFEKQS
jgi:hypothetical protein